MQANSYTLQSQLWLRLLTGVNKHHSPKTQRAVPVLFPLFLNSVQPLVWCVSATFWLPIQPQHSLSLFCCWRPRAAFNFPRPPSSRIRVFLPSSCLFRNSVWSVSMHGAAQKVEHVPLMGRAFLPQAETFPSSYGARDGVQLKSDTPNPTSEGQGKFPVSQ